MFPVGEVRDTGCYEGYNSTVARGAAQSKDSDLVQANRGGTISQVNRTAVVQSGWRLLLHQPEAVQIVTYALLIADHVCDTGAETKRLHSCRR